MRSQSLLLSIFGGLILISAYASNDDRPNFQFSGGNGLSFEDAVKVIGKTNQSEFNGAKLVWLRTRYPSSKTVNIEFPCFRGQQFHLHKIRVESGISAIYFDAGNVSDETIVNGRVRPAGALFDQVIEEIKKSDLPTDRKKEMLENMQRNTKQKKRNKCE